MKSHRFERSINSSTAPGACERPVDVVAHESPDCRRSSRPTAHRHRHHRPFVHTLLYPGIIAFRANRTRDTSPDAAALAEHRKARDRSGYPLSLSRRDRFNRDALTQTDVSRVFYEPVCKPLSSPHIRIHVDQRNRPLSWSLAAAHVSIFEGHPIGGILWKAREKKLP